MFQDEELEDSEKFYVEQPRVLQLIYALYNTLVARSEMVCYFVIILNHMISASMITLVLPILIFLWAMLSVPRPSKRFWMTAIVYTEVRNFWSAVSNIKRINKYKKCKKEKITNMDKNKSKLMLKNQYNIRAKIICFAESLSTKSCILVGVH